MSIESEIRKTNHLLIEAVQSGATETVKALIGVGADVNARIPDGRTPLMFAAVSGNTEIVGILLEAGAKLNDQAMDGTTALIKACLWGQVETVELLLAHGADRDMGSDDESSLLQSH